MYHLWCGLQVLIHRFQQLRARRGWQEGHLQGWQMRLSEWPHKLAPWHLLDARLPRIYFYITAPAMHHQALSCSPSVILPCWKRCSCPWGSASVSCMTCLHLNKAAAGVPGPSRLCKEVQGRSLLLHLRLNIQVLPCQ
jgi:hypothetical protein